RKKEKKQENTLLQLITSLAFGMQVMLIYLTQLYPLYNSGDFSSQNVRNLQYLVWALATPVTLVGGISFLKGAWRALMARTATMDTLVSMGTISAYLYSSYISLTGMGETYFDSVAMITTFILLGRYLEAVGGAQARKDIRHLLNLQPDKAWKKEMDEWQQVKTSSLLLGDTVLVKPGERIPVDGTILEGRAAGIGESRLAQITRIVEETLSQKPPIQRLADKASAFFAFGILAVAIVTVIGWYLSGAGLGRAILTGVSVLVVACPCALGLATPLAITVTLGKTTQAGILVRNLEALETAAKVQRMIFDKTGTLTRGEMQLLEIYLDSESDLQKEELLQIVASAEKYSEHPIAAAILQANNQPLLPVKNFKIERGAGIQADLEDPIHTTVKIGNLKFIGVKPHEELQTPAQTCSHKGETI
ncbi:MAG: HAD-IC family P-type ATPase, partial [Anaerolineales bacterium]